jgi:hypothetical protein
MAAIGAQAQPNFTPKSTEYAPPTAEVLENVPWLTPTNQTLDPGDGVERMVLLNNGGGYAVHMRGKYFVYIQSLESPGTWKVGENDYPAYPAKAGKYIVFIPGQDGLWGKTMTP